MKQVTYRVPKILVQLVNLTFPWCSLLAACELVHIFACKENDSSNDTESTRRHLTHCTRLEFVHHSCHYCCNVNTNKFTEFNSLETAE
jgi:hypothetical protein